MSSVKSDFKKLIDPRKVVALLVETRKNRGLTQRDVADRMGLGQHGQSFVASFERSPNPTISTMIRYATALDVDLSMSVHFSDMTVTQPLRSYY